MTPAKRPTGPLARLRAHVAEPLFSGAYNLIATTAITAMLGLGFWAVAARLYSPSQVGRDSVLINAMLAISSICQLNAWDSIVRFLPVIPPAQRARTVARTYLFSSLVAVCGSVAFVLVAPARRASAALPRCRLGPGRRVRVRDRACGECSRSRMPC